MKQEEILKCTNPNCGRYYRISTGDGEYCCRSCRCEVDFDFAQHDKKMQVILEQEYVDQNDNGG